MLVCAVQYARLVRVLRENALDAHDIMIWSRYVMIWSHCALIMTHVATCVK